MFDEAGVPEVLGVDARVEAMSMDQTSMIKDLSSSVLALRTRTSPIVIPA